MKFGLPPWLKRAKDTARASVKYEPALADDLTGAAALNPAQPIENNAEKAHQKPQEADLGFWGIPNRPEEKQMAQGGFDADQNSP